MSGVFVSAIVLDTRHALQIFDLLPIAYESKLVHIFTFSLTQDLNVNLVLQIELQCHFDVTNSIINVSLFPCQLPSYY